MKGAETVLHYYLVPVLGGADPIRYLVSGRRIIGRSERADITLREPTVSREHAAIMLRDGAVFLEDLGSKHGTFVNSRRVKAAQLKEGDLIVFGLAIVLRLEHSSQLIEQSMDEISQDPTSLSETQVTITQREALSVAPLASYFGHDETGNLSSQAHARNLAGLGSLCLELLPGAYARLTKLLASMNDLAEQRVKQVDVASFQSFVEPVLTTVARLMEVITEMSSRPTEVVSLQGVVKRAIGKVEPELSLRQIEVHANVPPSVKVQADPERLASVVAGLLANSGQSSLDGSLIEVEGQDTANSVVLEVIDQGVGYPQEMLLDAFQHLDAGLSPIAYRVWEARRVALALGGVLTVKTQQGIGSTVRIVLPAVDDAG